jgi:hypothetical protein
MRVVLFGSVSDSAREFVYRIKATNKGKYVVPPAFAESMYNRAIRARTLPGTMVVEEKKKEKKEEKQETKGKRSALNPLPIAGEGRGEGEMGLKVDSVAYLIRFALKTGHP